MNLPTKLDTGSEASNQEWANKVKSIKGEFFSTKESAVVHHERLYSENGIYRLKNQIEAEHVVNYSTGKVLDVGTGTGRFARPIHDAGFDVTGVDISEHMLEVAKEASGTRAIKWQKADVENLPFESASFDTVVSINVITHLPQWQSCVKEFKRVCKPGGRIIFDACSDDILKIANRKGLRYGAKAKKDDAHFFAEISLAEMCSFLNEAGLEIEAIISHDVFNSNYLIEDLLGSDKYAKFIDYLKAELLNNKAAFDLWCHIERELVTQLPTDIVYDYIVVANNGVTGKKQMPKPLSGYQKPIKISSFLQQCLGNKFDSTISSIDQLLADEQAYSSMAAIECEILQKIDPSFKLEDLFPQASIHAAKFNKGALNKAKTLFRQFFA